MLKIYSDRNKKMQFSMEIEGAENVQGVRMIFEGKENTHGIILNAYKENNKLSVDIPAFDKFSLKEGKAKIEVIADGMILNPWQDDFIVENSIKFNMEESKSNKTKNSNIKIKINEQKDSNKEKILYNRVLKSYSVLDENKKNKLKNRLSQKKCSIEEEKLLESFDFIKNKKSTTSKLFLEQLNKK